MTVRFVEEKVLPDDGQVNHALRGALSCLLRDYLVQYFFISFLINRLITCFVNKLIIFSITVIYSATGNRAYSRKIEFTKVMVLHATNNDDYVNIKSNHFYYLQGKSPKSFRKFNAKTE